MDDDKLVELAEEGDQISTRQNVDNDEDNSEIDNKVINHNHMFSASKGGPQVKQGDAQFDEEQGGASQLFEVHTKMACENMSSDDDVGDELVDDSDATNELHEGREDKNQDDEPAPPDDPPAAAVVPSAKRSSINSGTRGIVDDEDTATVEIPLPSPVESSANSRGKTTDHKSANNDSLPQQSPDRSTTDRSTCSFEGLRTQQTSQQSTQKAPRKKSAPSKISIMGTIFEHQNHNKKKKKNQSAKAKSSGLYIPAYSRK